MSKIIDSYKAGKETILNNLDGIGVIAAASGFAVDAATIGIEAIDRTFDLNLIPDRIAAYGVGGGLLLTITGVSILSRPRNDLQESSPTPNQTEIVPQNTVEIQLDN